MSPRSRGRPPGRGRRRQPGSRPATARVSPGVPDGPDYVSELLGEETAGCWFEEPRPGNRRSWAIPPGYGLYRGVDLELLDPDDDDDLTFLIEAMHGDRTDVSASAGSVTANDETVNPKLHVAMHHVVARQILADDPPKTWQAVQRLAGLGYDWHNIMHMIAALVVHDVHAALTKDRQPDSQDYARRLDQLPGDWPPPDVLY
jgi:hypothetical protein